MLLHISPQRFLVSAYKIFGFHAIAESKDESGVCADTRKKNTKLILKPARKCVGPWMKNPLSRWVGESDSIRAFSARLSWGFWQRLRGLFFDSPAKLLHFLRRNVRRRTRALQSPRDGCFVAEKRCCSRLCQWKKAPKTKNTFKFSHTHKRNLNPVTTHWLFQSHEINFNRPANKSAF